MLDTYGAADFEALIGEKFSVAGSENLVIELTAVQRRDLPGQEMFSVVFRGPASTQLSQATYNISNEKTGEGLLFLVPVSLIGNEIEYEAAFNRVIG